MYTIETTFPISSIHMYIETFDMYTCPRCNHYTNRKLNLDYHFNRKNLFKNENGVELTDDVKCKALNKIDVSHNSATWFKIRSVYLTYQAKKRAEVEAAWAEKKNQNQSKHDEAFSSNMYTCPRCNHCTNRKLNLEYHFNRKNICKNVNGVELTDDIKSKALEKRTFPFRFRVRLTV